jgi:beta-xylosidase
MQTGQNLNRLAPAAVAAEVLARGPGPNAIPFDPNINYPWVSDLGNGTFRNPVLFADYSDPDVARAGHDFYLTASSFNCTPGLPILHSRDLVNWKLVNHAVRNLPHPRFSAVQHGCGIWAPAIRFHNRRWWIFFSMPDEGIYVTTAEDPAGRWTEPQLVQEGRGLIDPCPFWDDDDQAYLAHAYAGSRAGIKHILRVRPMAPDGSRLLGEGQIVFHDPVHQPTIEGPKFLKRDGWYYILAPAGGVDTGWQLVLRSRNIYGPYQEKLVLAQGDTPVNGPHQGALVDTEAGEWWFLHFQCADLYGRVLHMQPVRWHDAWPLMGRHTGHDGVGEPVAGWTKPKTPFPCPVAVPDTSDDFSAPALGLQWQWHANHNEAWYSLDPQKKRLRLNSQVVPNAEIAKVPNLLLQKFPARAFVVDTTVEFSPQQISEEAGLVIMGEKHAALALRHTANGNRLYLRLNTSEHDLGEVSGNSIRLRVEVREGGLCRFSFAAGPDPRRAELPRGPVSSVPGTDEFHSVSHEFQARKGTWIGAKVGIYSLAPAPSPGFAQFDCFRFSPPS